MKIYQFFYPWKTKHKPNKKPHKNQKTINCYNTENNNSY